MTVDDWDERYAGDPSLYGEAPNAFVRQVAERIPPGPVLCLAEGQGRNAVYLAALGHEVLAVDQSTVALEGALALAARRGVTLRVQAADLAHFEIQPAAWSGIVATYVHVPPELRRKVFAAAALGLAPGGVFVLEAFATQQLGRSSGGPRDVDLLMSVDRLREEIPGLEWLHAVEIERMLDEGLHHQGMAFVVQVLGRRPVT